MRAVLFFIALVICDFNPNGALGISDMETTVVTTFFLFLAMDLYDLLINKSK